MTTRSSAPSTIVPFASPDGRIWERDVDHQAVPISPITRPIFERAFPTGMGRAFERIGAPLAGAEMCHVNGWSYLRMIPAGAPDKAGSQKSPPDLVLKIVSRLHPELRRRNKTALAALADKRWADDIDAWWDERSRWTDDFRRRQAIDLGSLDDATLADEVAAAVDRAEAMMTRHFELITPAVAIGLALVACAEHGITPTAVADSLRGCSASTSAPRAAIRGLAEAVADAGGHAAGSVEALRAVSPDVARQLDAYLENYGWRVLGDDLSERTLAEVPDILVRSIASVDLTEPREPDGDPIAGLVEGVPPHDRSRIEQLLRQAGRAYETLDDNSGVTCWGFGVARRTLLEAGQRLEARGLLTSTAQVFMLTADEVTTALRETGGPTADEIADRHAVYLASRDLDAPNVLGGDPSPPPDPGLLPEGLGTIAAAIGLYLANRFPPPDVRADTGRVEIGGAAVATGHGIGGIRATGRAVVARTAEEAIARLEPGDVLVCTCTNPAYNVVFPIASAVVTAVGGPFGHTAVTAREVGIPAVVGVGDLSVIADGIEITVIG